MLLLPLVGIIHVTASILAALGSGDSASVTSFTIATALSVTTYVVLPASAVVETCGRRRRLRAPE